MTLLDPDTDILSRPGANEHVMSKKVLLAALANAEADRLGIVPDANFVNTIRGHFLDGLKLEAPGDLAAWLLESGIGEAEFELVMRDFAAVVAVELHYAQALAARIALHRRLAIARLRRVDAQ